MRLLLLVALLGSLFLTSVGATPITYTITGLMDGFIVPLGCPPPCLTPVFTGSAFTFEFNGDTSGIFHLTPSVLGNSVLSSSLTIAARGSGDFTESLEVTDQTTSGTVGFADLALANSILLKNSVLIGWDMATTIGPVGNTGLFLASTNKFDTSLGTLTVSDAFSLSFSAVVNTPEPATAGLVGITLLAAAGLRRRIARRLPPALFGVLALTLAAAPAALAQGFTFTTIDFPGAPDTEAIGINARGEIVGDYGPSVAQFVGDHGFLLSQGAFSPIDFPGGTFTFTPGINARGEIVGSYSDSAGVFHGFQWTHGSFTSFDVPFAGAVLTAPNRINASGQIVGVYTTSNSILRGFLLSNGAYSQIDFPGAAQGSEANGISDDDQIVGDYFDSSGNPHGYIWSRGTFQQFDVPGARGTFGLDINNRGEIVGWYTDTNAVTHGYVLSRGTYTTIDVPGAAQTNVLGINNSGSIVGRYLDANGIVHAFMATPNR